MARLRSRRIIVIGIVIVALSVGLVFSLLPYLQPAPPTRASIQSTYVHSVASATTNGPGNFGLTIPSVTASEPFTVNVTVVGGSAEFCVITYQTYYNFGLAYNSSSPQPFPSSACIYGPTKEMTHGILDFALTPGTWDVVALNYSTTTITVYYSPSS